jgi:hypothetical protein
MDQTSRPRRGPVDPDNDPVVMKLPQNLRRSIPHHCRREGFFPFGSIFERAGGGRREDVERRVSPRAGAMIIPIDHAQPVHEGRQLIDDVRAVSDSINERKDG